MSFGSSRDTEERSCCGIFLWLIIITNRKILNIKKKENESRIEKIDLKT
jgi:hypothetical protein